MTAPTPLPPSAFLAEEMRARGWTVADTAAMCGMKQRLVEKVLQGRQVTWTVADCLAKGFGTTPDYWWNLQRAWDEHKRRTR